MELVVLARLLSELSVYFAFSGVAILILAPTQLTLLAPIWLGVCGMAAWLLREKRGWKILPLILSLGVLSLAGGWGDILALAPACGYVIWLSRTGRLVPDGPTFTRFFKIGTGFTAFWALLAGVSIGFARCEQMVLPFLLCEMVAGAYALRMLRHHAETIAQPRLKWVNLVTVGAILLAGWLISSERVLGLLRQGLFTLYSWTVRPLLMGIAYLASGLMWLVGRLGVSHRQEMEPNFWDTLGESVEQEIAEWEAAAGLPGWARVALIVLACALFIGLAVLLFRALGRRREDGEERRAAERRTFLDPQEAGQTDRQERIRGRTPREAVRQQYQRLLAFLKAEGGTLPLSDTTLDVNRRFEDADTGRDFDALRTLYLHARYDENTPVDREAAKQAKQHVQAIKSVHTQRRKRQ